MKKKGIHLTRHLAPPAPKTLGVYVHIPFCVSKCDYCDFYSLAGAEDKMGGYLTALLRHMGEVAPRARGLTVDTVYFGGGTPSYFGADRLVRLHKTLRRLYRVDGGAEVTAEANPGTVDKGSLKKLRRSGFNRLSLGMQSASDAELAAVHRAHSTAQTEEAVAAARAAGFRNLSLDLMYGLPGQTMERWRHSVETALRLEPEHLSCYGLKPEPGTPLVTRGDAMPSEDEQADRYLWMVERLRTAGYAQYEISNFAREGFASRHNLKYWRGEPYAGFGAAAHSDFGDRRYACVQDIDAFVAAMEGRGTLLEENDEITRRERAAEYLMLRLRTTEGVDGAAYRSRYNMDFEPVEAELRAYAARGWAEQTDGRWHFTPEGFLLSNRLIGALLELQTELTTDRVLAAYRSPAAEGAQAADGAP